MFAPTLVFLMLYLCGDTEAATLHTPLSQPTAQLGAILCLAEGVLLLQPTRTPNRACMGRG